MKYLLLAGFIALFLSACGGGTSDMDYDKGTFDSVRQTVNWNTEVTIQLNHTAGAQYKIEKQPKNGSATISNSGLVTYMPNTDFVGYEFFEVSTRSRTSEGIHVLFTKVNISVEKMPLSMTETSFIFYDYQPVTGKLIAKNAVGKPTFTTAFTSSDETFELHSDGSFTFQRTNKAYSNLLYLTSIPVTVKDSKSTTTLNISFKSKTDPLFFEQWYLRSTGSQKAFSQNAASEGHDINIGTLHYDGNTGKNVKVAVVDTGLEIGHEDLKNNVLPGRSRNYVKNGNSTTNPSPTDNGGDHGTSVAGIIAAEAFNNKGGRGVAPAAKLLGFNFLEEQSEKNWIDSHGGTFSNDVQIVNESYGVSYIGPVSFDQTINLAAESHLKKVTATNNTGRGMLMVKSAGNSFEDISVDGYKYAGNTVSAVSSSYSFDQKKPKTSSRLSAHIAGLDEENSSIYHTVISALNSNKNDPLASYSSVGSSIWVSAPGGEYGSDSPAMITTDVSGCEKGYAQIEVGGFDGGLNTSNLNCDYTSTFNGTSSAAPVVSGVAALIWQANSSLSWRDVRHILASTAQKVDPNVSPVTIANSGNSNVIYTATPDWITNGADYNFHNWYGFGMVNATAAVNMAKNPTYQPLPALQETDFINPTDTSSVSIPENDNNGAQKTINVTKNLTIEAVQVKISATHGRDADLAIELISPAGTKSVVLQPQSLLVEDQMDGFEATNTSTSNFNNTVLLTNAFYGENSQGNWTVKVIDTNSGDFFFYLLLPEGPEGNDWYRVTSKNTDPGTLDAVSIRIYGH